MKAPFLCLAGLLLASPFLTCVQASGPLTSNPEDLKVDYNVFKDPPQRYKGVRWYNFGMNKLSEDGIKAAIDEAAKVGAYGGIMMTPDRPATTNLSPDYFKASGRRPNPNGVAYLSDEYFKFYKIALDESVKVNLPVSVLYDEVQFPTGSAGGLFYSKYPQDTAKSLEKAEKDITGPGKVEVTIPLPTGIYIGAVLMNLDTFERIDVSDKKNGSNTVAVDAPKGNWKLMVFYLDPTFRKGLCDYLDAKAVDEFINITYQSYYSHFKEYFGKVIQMTFYDEPALHHVAGRTWTPGFNAGFEKKYGYSPMKYYPALWYNIGPETAQARNALYGYRSDLYAENFIGRIAAWCAAHGIDMAGHQDQEEPRSPVATTGDLMKTFKLQQIPGIDDIWVWGRTNVSYKVVTSSAFNWDKPLMMAETFAAYRKFNKQIAYKTTMDQFAMGVNLQVGNRSRKDTWTLGPGQQGGEGPNEPGAEMGRYLGRLSYMLRHGRHVADIAMLYPIASLQSAYAFASPVVSKTKRLGSSPDFYYALEGGIIPPGTDYMDLGETLFRGLHIDYTYIHPEILDGRTSIANGRLTIDNKENREEFRVLILPGCDTLSLASAKKIQEFYQSGGTVIATAKLATRATELKDNKEVQRIIGEVFGLPAEEPMTAEIRASTDDYKTWFAHFNPAGGKAFFLPQPDAAMITSVLKEALPVRDVDVQMPASPVKLAPEYDGALTYIHKVKDGKDIYFFANSQDTPVSVNVVLRGKKDLAIWNPHTGERQKAEAQVSDAGEGTTTVHLALAPVTSTFYVQE
ncbi:MAG TPA: glycosyl hydrolase [Bryobacteraceae bacterium]|nr:glycosyl hydrolase [Bryobacteraceae bacterium]